MKIRVIYNDTTIICADKPEGAAALDYELHNMVIAEHTDLLPRFFAAGFDVSKISEFLTHEGVAIEQPEWMPKLLES